MPTGASPTASSMMRLMVPDPLTRGVTAARSPIPSGKTPREMGFRMPAEWEWHRGTWLSWPHRISTWPGKFDPIPRIFAEIVRHLSSSEQVHINVCDASVEAQVHHTLEEAAVDPSLPYFHHFPTDDAWCRDHGPIFLVREQEDDWDQVVLDWGYNAWGGKYPPFELDDAIPTRIGTHFSIPVIYPGLVMEGGSFDVNGRGTLLTTESCLLNPNRNPGLSREDLEQALRDHLAVSQVLWLGEGIEGDDTDGHVDDITRFVDPTTVVTCIEDDPSDVNYEPLLENVERLQEMTDQDGHPLRVVPLPMPRPVWYQGQRLPASYANFYIGNEVVLLPAYDHETTGVAREVLEELFPTRRVVPIDCFDLIWGLGAFHCVTQQWPGRPLPPHV